MYHVLMPENNFITDDFSIRYIGQKRVFFGHLFTSKNTLWYRFSTREIRYTAQKCPGTKFVLCEE